MVDYGVVPLLLASHCRLVSGKPLLRNKRNLACDSMRPCGHNVFNLIKCQVAHLNISAQGLFDAYLESQGTPFTKANVDSLCVSEDTFPSFVNQTSKEKEMLVALYKISVFFNASLGNITRDQKNRDSNQKDLLERLGKTSSATRGLLANLTCLLCSKYKVSNVEVTYGSDKKAEFERKRQGCWVLKMYTKAIDHAAQALGKCH
ncbi:leukemia inhibitory factor [Rhineura floridana]|uniref:leukemia inhibitory factor n=1 Tax=Rhineura floridana TaxID=261503 RepID=UPI002AC7F6FD|nr:leukemia inhibitory factor [Rhineura floridana]